MRYAVRPSNGSHHSDQKKRQQIAVDPFGYAHKNLKFKISIFIQLPLIISIKLIIFMAICTACLGKIEKQSQKRENCYALLRTVACERFE